MVDKINITKRQLSELHTRAINNLYEHPEIRLGQSYYIEALDMFPEIKEYTNTEYDPFYKDSNLAKFFGLFSVDTNGSTMSDSEIELFVEKMMDKIVQFYHNQVTSEFGGEGYDTDEESFYRALGAVTATAFVSAESVGKRLFLYALDPMGFLPVNVKGEHLLWDFIRNWAKEKFNLELALGKYTRDVELIVPIYDHTKEYLLETKRMVDDEAMSFQDAFLEDNE